MILITGASGHVRGRVLSLLAEAGRRVRVLSRTPERTAWPAGAEVVRGDLSDPATLPAALAGVEAVLVAKGSGQSCSGSGHDRLASRAR